jgi:hypothetical protein
MADAVLHRDPPADRRLPGRDQCPAFADRLGGDRHGRELTERGQLGQPQGVVTVGLAFGVLELPGFRRRVGDQTADAEFAAQVMDPTGQGAGLDDDQGGRIALDQLSQFLAAAADGAEGNFTGIAIVNTGDALVLAQVDGENGADGGNGHASLRWGEWGLGERW